MDINKVYNIDCLEGIRLMKEQNLIPNLIICDPPYEFEAMGGGVHKIGSGGALKYQKIIDIGTNHFDFNKFIPAILDLQYDKVNAYFFCNKVLIPKYLNEAIKRDLSFDILVLKKNNPIPAKHSSYVPELEYIIFLRSPSVCFNNSLKLSYYKKVFSVDIGHSNLVHPNQKPIRLIENYIKVSSNEGDLVLDCFMGSGTTAVACKGLKRNFIGFELDKSFVDVCNSRLKQENLFSFTL